MAAGLLLAGGAGRRMGTPKALVELDGEPLVRRALRVLEGGGCGPLVVVVGAAADAVRALLPAGVTAVEATDWAEGMGASLRAGLAALARPQRHGMSGSPAPAHRSAGVAPDAALVHLVDLPGVTSAAVARLAAGAAPHTLRRAAYGGDPGHPVVLGREHWAAVGASATGDAGARDYLRGHPDLELVECGDVAEPGDVDTLEALELFRRASHG